MAEFQLELSDSQARILDAARELFSQHGVAGTSLKMIAEAVGVSKAAIYHQYPAKEDIVYAVGQQINVALSVMTELVSSEADITKRRRLLLDQIISLAVENRHIAGRLQQDPHFLKLFREQPAFVAVMTRLEETFIGGEPEPHSKAVLAMLITGVAGAVMHPICDELDNKALSKHLTKAADALIGLI